MCKLLLSLYLAHYCELNNNNSFFLSKFIKVPIVIFDTMFRKCSWKSRGSYTVKCAQIKRSLGILKISFKSRNCTNE